ncbi:MAG: GlsB/YeaQ/YmgE family stress response membrane protein [Hyphomicrobiaceae bacterium]|nr:GlsB/YeaQ/YmgE family stress response membrane protein [Hyphomicrobiaceae bacterium]
MDKRALVVMLVVGAVSGWLASFVVGSPRWGLVGYIVAGVIGGVVGGWMLDAAKIRVALGHPIADSIAQGAIGAIAVIIVARILS